MRGCTWTGPGPARTWTRTGPDPDLDRPGPGTSTGTGYRVPGTGYRVYRVPGIAHKIRLSARECPRVLYELLNPGTRHMVCAGTGDRPGEDDRATGNPSEVC